MTISKSKKLGNKGFSLIELSFVLIIAGLLISVGVGVMNSLTKRSKMAREKAAIETIKNSLISYGLSHGRLPCPDTDSDGAENCPVSNCGAPPCNLPYIDLSLSAADKDTWSLPYSYDVTDILTTTDSKNFCVTLYQLSNLYDWYGSPAGASCGGSNMACVTDITDGDNGMIDSQGKGYYLAAHISSGGEDYVQGGKNIRDGRREYEMVSNPYDITVGRDDMVGELSFGDLSGKLCTAQNTAIEVTITAGEVWLDSSGGCAATTGLTNTINVLLGQTLYYKAGCTESDTFEQLARCELSPALYTGTNSCAAGTALDGKVGVNGAAVPAAITQ